MQESKLSASRSNSRCLVVILICKSISVYIIAFNLAQLHPLACAQCVAHDRAIRVSDLCSRFMRWCTQLIGLDATVVVMRREVRKETTNFTSSASTKTVRGTTSTLYAGRITCEPRRAGQVTPISSGARKGVWCNLRLVDSANANLVVLPPLLSLPHLLVLFIRMPHDMRSFDGFREGWSGSEPARR
jgi:hypothetical protein